jgi:MFS family permease
MATLTAAGALALAGRSQDTGPHFLRVILSRLRMRPSQYSLSGPRARATDARPATPSFTVYFVRDLGFSMSFVLILSVVSQLANVAVIRGWGALSDRFANKSVLTTASPLFILCIFGVSLTNQIDGAEARIAYLALLHALMGAAAAGVGLASGNIVMTLSPAGSATNYMATNALVSAIAAGVAHSWRPDGRFFRLAAHLASRQLVESTWHQRSVRPDVHPVGVLFSALLDTEPLCAPPPCDCR